MRILAVDYGTARVGLALSDEMGILASPFRTLAYSKGVVEEIAEIVRAEGVGLVVVGIPYDLKERATESTERTKRFAAKLREALPCGVEELDESLTSKRAVARMVEAGIKKGKRREKGQTDMWAAAIILQDYLDSE